MSEVQQGRKARYGRRTVDNNQRTARTTADRLPLSPRLRARLTSLPVGLLPLILPFLLFPAEAAGRSVFYFHDIQYYFLPYHKLVADLLRNGRLPLWNPYAFGGIPLLGDGQTALLYPPNWLFLLLPTELALNQVVLLQFAIAGSGMFQLIRHLGASRAAATLAAISYMFNGFMVGRVVHLSIMSGAAMLPWVFWAIDRLRQRPSPLRLAIAVVVVALQIAAGHPQVPVYTVLGLGLYLTGVSLSQPDTRGWRHVLSALGWQAAAFTGGACLAAVQLLPWIDFARLSPRAAGSSFGFVAATSLVGVDWLLLVIPYLFGGLRTGLFHPEPPRLATGSYIYERAGYVGLLPLALAVLALLLLATPRGLRRDQRAAAIGLLLMLLAGLVIAGSQYSWVAELIYAMPVLGKLRAPARAIVLCSFAIPALAALALDTLVAATRHGVLSRTLRWQLLVVAGAIAALFTTLIWIVPSRLDPGAAGLRDLAKANLSLSRPALLVPVLWGSLAIALLLWWARVGATRWVACAVLLTGIDLAVWAIHFNPTLPRAELSGVPPSITFLQRDPDPFRTATFMVDERLTPSVARAQLAQSWGMAFGIASVGGFNSLQPRRYTDLLYGPGTEDVSYGFLWDSQLLQPGNWLLPMLNTKYVLIQPPSGIVPGPDYRLVYRDQQVLIYRNQQVLPRAFFVPKVRLAVTAAQALTAVTADDFDPRAEAIVEDRLDLALLQRLSESPTSGATTNQATATVVKADPTRIELLASTDKARLLVVSEMDLPGWYASIDGRPVAMFRTNYLLRGLVVPPGQHRIVMIYRPPAALAGAALSLLSIIGLGAIIAFGKRRPLT